MTDPAAPDTRSTAPEQAGPRPEACPHMDGAFAGQAFLGSLAIVYATGVVFLALADDAAGLRFMPRSWYVNRLLWYCSAVLGYVAGFYLLRPPRREPLTWNPVRAGARFARLVVYTREGCHLCDEAIAVLWRYAAWLPALETIDIDSDPQLVERFGTSIPVVEIDGRVRFQGCVNEVLLRRLIEGTPPRTEGSGSR